MLPGLTCLAGSRYAQSLIRLLTLPGLAYLAGSRYAQSSFRLLTLTRLDIIRVSHLYGSYACLYL